MKKHFIISFAVITSGIFITFLLSKVNGGFSLVSGWRGMSNLDRMGWPFSWKTECPNYIESIPPSPTGCQDGFNLYAFGLNILFFSIILFLIVEIILFFRKNY